MDQRSAKRIDSLYRNLKQLTLLGCLGFFIPIIGILLLPIVFAYWYLRSKLLSDQIAGRIELEEHDRIARSSDELSTEEKLDFIKNEGGRCFIVPAIVGSLYLVPILLFALYVARVRS